MASILTTAGTPPEEPKPQRWQATAADAEFLTPHLLLQLEDELERARRREAAWISIMVHLLLVLLLVNTTRLFPGLKGPIIASAADLMKNQQLTYLDLPPDLQKEPPKPPPTNVISDKNRVAESRHPQIDKKTLQELKRAGAPGLPAPRAPQQQQAQAAPPPQQPQGQQPQASQQQGQQQQMAMNNQPVLQDPRLAVPQQGSAKPSVDFRNMMSAGQQINQAANAVAMGRTAPSVGFGGAVGSGGDYGAGKGGAARVQGNLEVLSDTQGVDFGPYLSRVLQAVRQNWYAIIPESARPPLLKRGKVSIQFVILPTGKVAGMQYTGSSGDIALDRAAWGGITASDPFSPLPKEFHGPYLALRFHFFYNPQKGDLE
jgi:TonB family protein